MYNILDYGAKTDGTLCTRQIQKAIDECFMNGGGEVVIPEGIFLTGGIRLRSNVTLHFLKNAVLKGSVNPDDYFDYLEDEVEPIPEKEKESKVVSAMLQANGASVYPYSRWNNAVIRAINAENIAIIGEEGSGIDGQNCYDEQGEENYRGPHGINIWFCENIKLVGYTLKDIGNWAHAIQNSKQISAENITVLGGHDGFDIRTCDNITITGCKFYTGDDAIAGFDNINVRIKDCTLNSSCSAMRFGGNDIIVENCTVSAPNKYGFRGSLSYENKKCRAQTNADNSRFNCLNAFLYYCDYRANIRKTPGNILIKNCILKNVDSVFAHIFGHVWACNRSLSDITFENCVFDGVCEFIKIECDKDEPITFKMKNCVISARDGAEDGLFMAAHDFKHIILENVVVSGYTNPQIMYSSDGEITLKNTPGVIAVKGEKKVYRKG